jgi:hypothetical protein
MSLASRLGLGAKMPTIIAYCLTEVVNGDAKSKTIGRIPAVSKDYQQAIRSKHRPNGKQFINETFGTTPVILAWVYDHIDAVCFLSESDAQAFPGFLELSEPERKVGRFLHFP